jgi:YggT family protein
VLDQILIFIFNTVLGLLSLALLLRFYMQLINIPYHNPASHFLVALTQFILIAGIYKLQANNFSSDIATTTMALMLLAFVEIIKTTFHIVMVAIIGQAVLSWFSPQNPMAPMLDSFTRPFLSIFRERIRPVGNIDLSPIFVLIIIQLLLMVTTGLQRDIYQLF